MRVQHDAVHIDAGQVDLVGHQRAGFDDVLDLDDADLAGHRGKICIVEVERIVATGEIAPDDVHLPGIYVHRIVHNPTPEKRIEKRTLRDRK